MRSTPQSNRSPLTAVRVLAGTVTLGVLLGATAHSHGQAPVKPPATEGDKTSRPEPVKAPPPQKDDGISTRVQLAESEIKSHLEKLFEWSGSSKYYYYFFMMSKPLQLNQLYAAAAERLPDKQYLLVNPYDNKSPSHGPCITLTYPAQLKALPNNSGICVVLDGVGKPVPVQAAEVMASGFSQGFVTRLVVGEYVRAWNAKGANISIDSLNFAAKWDPSLPQEKDIERFADINSYMVGADKDRKVQYESGMVNLLRSHNLQMVGLLYGWQAASELDALRAAKNANVAYFDTALSLVKTRFEPKEVGEITSYTLHYLLGYVRIVSERQRPTPAEAPAASNDQILTRLTKEDDVKGAKRFMNLFGSVLVDEFEAMSTSTMTDGNSVTAVQKKKLQAYSGEFLKGFLGGSVKAVDDIAVLGYQTGYRDGFKDGYTRGYADGYRDGYAAGHKKAWEEANNVIESIRKELELYEKEIDALRSENDKLKADFKKRSGIGSFLEDIGRGIVKGFLGLFGL